MFDVAVIGAGPAGSIAALMLARAGRKVVLVARATLSPKRIGESLPGAARPLLRHLGILALVESAGHLPSVGNSSAWGSERLETTDSIRDPAGPGWHLDRTRFDQDLRGAAITAGVDLKSASVRSISRKSDLWRLKCDDGSQSIELEARWLVNATGRGTLLPQLLGTKARRDDDLIAVYAWLPRSSRDREDRTLVEAAPEGWWYSSRLPDKSRVLVFHTRPETARRLLRSRVNFRRQLLDTSHVSGLVRGRARLPLRLAATSACGSMLEAVSGEGWIACGDAALAFDPLSSQGIFNALYTGMKSGEAAHRALEGDTGALKAYGDRLAQIRAAYLQHRNQFYSMERRWPNAPFWKGIKAHES